MTYPAAYRKAARAYAGRSGTRATTRLSTGGAGSGGFRPPANDNRPWPKLRPANDNNPRLDAIAKATARKFALQAAQDTFRFAMGPYRALSLANHYLEGVGLVQDFVNDLVHLPYRPKPAALWNGWNGTVCPQPFTRFSTSATLSCAYTNSVIDLTPVGEVYQGSGNWWYSRAWYKYYIINYIAGNIQFLRRYRLKWEFSKWVTNPADLTPEGLSFLYPATIPVFTPGVAPAPAPQVYPEVWPDTLPIHNPQPVPVPVPFPLIPTLPAISPMPQGRQVGNTEPSGNPLTDEWPTPNPQPTPRPDPNPRKDPPDTKDRINRKKWGNHWTGRAWGAVNLFFETQEWIDIAYKALDDKAKRSCGRAWNSAQKAACVFANFDSLDEEKFIRGVIANQIEDYIIGLEGRIKKKIAQQRFGATDHWAFKEIERQMKKKYGDDYTNLPTRDISKEAQKWADKVIDLMKQGHL